MPDLRPTIPKRATGIAGFDIISRGGLPSEGITLVQGDVGAGKTIFALNVLASAAAAGKSGIFVAFEEPVADIVRNARSFDWDLESQLDARVFMVDARPPGRIEISGTFDITGLLAALASLCERVQPDWIVLDGLDQLLALTSDTLQLAGELARLRDWLSRRKVAALITAKQTDADSLQANYLNHLRFHVGTVIALTSTVKQQQLARRLRIVKYRGSAHETEDVPLILNNNGINLPYSRKETAPAHAASNERVSSGVQRLDTLLGGGYFRGTTILVTGAPGASKTSFAAAFAHAAASRGETALYISFDETAGQIIRNIRSIGMDLGEHVDSGKLVIMERRSWRGLVEEHYLDILHTIEHLAPTCVVIDPISAMQKTEGDTGSLITIERMCDMMKERGITTVITSLLDTEPGEEQRSAAHVSTIADTWLSLKYQVSLGERNRAISVVKARGTEHSNQVREVILSQQGIDLADVYALGSEVLMGTARLHKQHEVKRRRGQETLAQHKKTVELQQQLEAARNRAIAVEREIDSLKREIDQDQRALDDDRLTAARWQDDIRDSRFTDIDAAGQQNAEQLP